MNTDLPEPAPLHPLDARALDALVEASFEPVGVPASLRPRAQRILDLLNTLDAGSDARRFDGSRESLIEATLDRVSHAVGGPAFTAHRATLSDLDQAALDALLAAEWDVSRLHPSLAPRAARLLNLLAGLDRPGKAAQPAASRELLIEQTLARVAQAAQQTPRDRFRLDPALDAFSFAPRRRLRLRDVFSAAASVALISAVFWPIVASWRAEARLMHCETNMQSAAVGFGMYAGDHRGSLPLNTAGFGGGWWHVGEPERSHSANLYSLARDGYARLETLACPGNHGARTHEHDMSRGDWRSPQEVSYSYQLPARPRLQWYGVERSVILADKSPIIDRARAGERFDPEARSHNHSGRGQNLLFNDGSVVFVVSPVLPNGDNIWLPRTLERLDRPTLRGVERPESPSDAFLVP